VRKSRTTAVIAQRSGAGSVSVLRRKSDMR
jgi:hypothetical protein